MKTCQLMIVSLLFATPARALMGGHTETDDSNFVTIVTAGATCAGALLSPDLLLTSGRCISMQEQQYPELIAYFHGQALADEDSDRNPVREVEFYPRPVAGSVPGGPMRVNADFALLRLSAPLGAVGGVAAGGFPIYRGNLEAIHDVTCFAMGPRDGREVHFYGNTLASADYTVTGHVGAKLLLSGPVLIHPFDAGGACFVNGPSGRELAAVLSSAVEPMSITGARQWISEFRTNYQMIAPVTGMCVGKVPGGGGRVWQYPCADPAKDFARDQLWLLRRLTTGPNNVQTFQIRTQLYSNHCLGIQPQSGGMALFSSCEPDRPTWSSWPMFLPSDPRPEQLWTMNDLADGAVQIVNQSNGLCLSFGGATSVGSFAVQEACNESVPDQHFRINAVEMNGGPFRLASYDEPTRCVDIAGASSSPGAAVIQYNCSGDANQRFYLARATGTTFQYVIPSHSFEAVEVPGFSTTPGKQLLQASYDGDANQQWTFSWDSFGAYRLMARHDGQCATVPSTDSGVAVTQNICHFDGPMHEARLQSWTVE